ncbi:hypothetical protein PHISCL_07129 [Aspergillus sclerotialis]|uniref:GST N-terminal domain-containing protein n=1 Tax=Aspergillus sclerotialis TaxID=2070753 RepID=A0A3A2ZC74_9EURO|nr:hypothetical protein PHISCL_07129 [Aspergillus sclerotialis]
MSETREQRHNYHLIGSFTRYSGWTARVETVLEYFGIPYTVQFITYKEISRVSPSGLVPLLEYHTKDRSIQINDTLAICEFLAESNPELNLWPRDQLLRAIARSAAAEMHSGFLTLRNTFHTNFVAHFSGNIPISEQAMKEIERLLALWDNARRFTKARLAEINEKDGGFLFGEYSIADAFFWPVLWRFRTYNLPLDRASTDVLAWIEKMWNDPVMQRLAHHYYRQEELPESRIEKYDDVFKGQEGIYSGRFPENWRFSLSEPAP